MPYWWYLGEGAAFGPSYVARGSHDSSTNQSTQYLVLSCFVQEGHLFIYSRQVFFWGGGSWFYAFEFLWFSASLLFCFCFSAFCFSCFSAFPASLLFAFPASLLFCFSVFPASLLLYFWSFLLLLFYFFFSSVICFCCSTSSSFASLLPVFAVSLFFIFFCFILFCLYPKWNPRETLGETQRNPKEILIKKKLHEALNEP